MNKIGIFVNKAKDPNHEFTNHLITLAKNVGINAELAEDNDYDLIISLGGDGTFLGAAIKYFNQNIPVAGINLGTLGYLSTIKKDELEDALIKIKNNEFFVEERMVLETALNNETYYALNDIVLNRGSYEKMISLSLEVDDKYLDKYNADGLIIATPTGSTAYSLSAGGPVLEPTIDAMLITPVCSHSLNKRPLIISSNRIITVNSDENETFMLSCDGHKYITELKTARIKKSTKKVKVIKLKDNLFFDKLREKFM